MQREGREHEASFYDFYNALGFPLPPLLLPVFPSVSELLPDFKMKVPSHVSQNNSCQVEQSTHKIGGHLAFPASLAHSPLSWRSLCSFICL